MKKVEEDAPAVNTGSIPNPAQTAMGPRFTTTNVMDRRKKKRPALLKRFSRFIENINEDVNEKNGPIRIDYGKPNFNNPKKYHIGDGGSTHIDSGFTDKDIKDLGPGKIQRATFASDHDDPHQHHYAMPRHSYGHTYAYHPGTKTIHTSQATYDRMLKDKKSKVTITQFDKKDFKRSNLPGEQYSTKKNLTPVRQTQVHPLEHLKNNGIKIVTHKDDDALRKHVAEKMKTDSSWHGEGHIGF